MRPRMAASGVLELVGDIGDEVGADLLQLAQLADVVQHQDRTLEVAGATAQRRGDELDYLVLVRRGDPRLGDVHLLLLHGGTQRVAGFPHPGGFPDAPAHRVHRGHAQDRFRGRVDVHDALFAVDGNHALHHAGEDGFRLVAVGGNGVDVVAELRRHRIEGLGKDAHFVVPVQ